MDTLVQATIVGCVVLLVVALNVWYRNYMRSLTPKEREKAKKEDEEQAGIW